MKGKTTPAPAVTPRKYAEKDFVELYQELCKETGFQIVFAPQWAQSKDTGDYRLVIVSSVAPMPKEE
ncbi:MAG TPA: hypothetical protein VI753_16330 [Anaerolineales bacterium]|nr:hypothetical protein [Anaerolineales bacterium]